MKIKVFIALCICGIASCCLAVKPQMEKGFQVEIPSSEFVNVTGVAFGKNGNILAAGGKNDPVVILDKSGKLICKWGSKHIKTKHGLRVHKNCVWVTDIGNHQVLKFSPAGKLLLAIGEKGVTGQDKKHFNKPTDVAFAPDGNIYISDGYGNNRIVCMTPDGKFLFDWGTAGKEKGQFKYPHNIVVDKSGKVYVADRGNNRIQVFTRNGKFLDEWKDIGKPYGLEIAKNGNIWAAVTNGNKWHGLVLLNNKGEVLKRFGGKPGKMKGKFNIPHSVSIDKAGKLLLVGEVKNQRIQIIKNK